MSSYPTVPIEVQNQLTQMLLEHRDGWVSIQSLAPKYIWVYFSEPQKRKVICCADDIPTDATHDQRAFFLVFARVIDALTRSVKRGVFGDTAKFAYRYSFAGNSMISIVVSVSVSISHTIFQTSHILRFDTELQQFSFESFNIKGKYYNPVFGSVEITRVISYFIKDFNYRHESGLKRVIADHRAVLNQFKANANR